MPVRYDLTPITNTVHLNPHKKREIIKISEHKRIIEFTR